MNNKNNRKGFTIVELVIVIAVIAILAAVLIPTFGNIIEKAQYTAAKQEAKNLFTNYVAATAESGKYVDDCFVKTSDGYYVELVDGGVVDGDPVTELSETDCYYLLDGGKMTPTKGSGCTVADCFNKGNH